MLQKNGQKKCNVAAFKDTRRGPGTKTGGQTLEARKAKAMDSPLEPPEKNAALQVTDFSPMRLLLDSHLESCKIIDEDCFKPLNLWSFVTATIGHQ